MDAMLIAIIGAGVAMELSFFANARTLFPKISHRDLYAKYIR
jgi:hypothetical protein